MKAQKAGSSHTEIRVPAHIQPYVTAIGIEKTVRFLLAFGGSYAYLSERPQDRSPVAQEIGRDAAIALAKQICPHWPSGARQFGFGLA